MKEKLKSTKGITLIALIITIIILIILAIVSIKLVMDSDIITHSETATKKYSEAEEQEKIKLGLAAIKMASVSNSSADLTVDGATVDGDKTNGWTVTFDGTENVYTVDADGNITKVEATTPPDSGEAIYYNVSFKNVSTIDWTGLTNFDTEKLILEDSTGNKQVVQMRFQSDDTYPSIYIDNLDVNNVILDGNEDTCYKCYEEKGAWIIVKCIGESNKESITSLPTISNVKIVSGTIYIEEEGSRDPLEWNDMTEAHRNLIMTFEEVK